MRRPSRLVLAAIGTVATVALVAPAIPAQGAGRLAAKPTSTKVASAVGTGGAVATVDLDATRIGLDVLAKGGNAVDAAVAAAAALGVTEPYSAGLGGGGFFVFYNGRTGALRTIDGRETSPRRMTETSFQENGRPIPFDEAVTSGLSVGVPGTPMTWQEALDRWGTRSLRTVLEGPRRLAARGFRVDQTFYEQTEANQARFNSFTSTRELFLPNGAPPPVGSVFKNPDLARTYAVLGRQGAGWAYDGSLASDIARAAAHPPVAPDNTRNVRSGLMTSYDLAAYFAPVRRGTRMKYRDYTVFGMDPPSSGGSTVGEALNILENANLRGMSRAQALHYYLESTALAFADRGRYVGDPLWADVPLKQLLSDAFAKERFCRIDPARAATKPVGPGEPDGSYDTNCDGTVDRLVKDNEGLSTTHVTTADKWGNVVAYTLTIEQTGGSGIVVPNRGFLLNNELTDFNFSGPATDPNLPGPNKRPRSSMSPTIVMKDGKPFLALGSPGGSTIITTVLQTLINRIDFGMRLPAAVAAPRASQRNTPSVLAEALFPRSGLEAMGHTFAEPPPPGEIGAATAIEFLSRGRMLAVAEPTRRGGGSAGVVRPTR